MKLSRLLCVILPLTTALAHGQTAGTVRAEPISVGPISSGGTTLIPPTTPPAATVVPISTIVPIAAPVTAAATTITGETSLSLDVGFGIRYVPPSRVTVPVGEVLRVTAPRLSDDVQYIWTKNGRAVPGATSNVLHIAHVTSDDAGVYLCLFSTPTTMPRSSQGLILGVGPTERLLNLSNRTMINSANPTLVSGFVVSGAREKKLIVRAVGPSLALFGEPNPLRAPVLQIFDSTGAAYEAGYAYVAVVGGPTYESDLADSSVRAGAFPLPEGSRDAVQMKPFSPGSYTAQITSADGTSGAVLLEIYEVP